MALSRNTRVFSVAALAFGTVTILASSNVHLPDNHQGYRPEQPIHYSHRLHAGELDMDCLFCHYGAVRSRSAGYPPAELCMGCHKHVTASFDVMLAERLKAQSEEREPDYPISDALRPLYDALALDENLEPIPGKEPQPIEWVRVHNLPDYVYFDHRPHVAREIACETCHGPVGSMERVRQESNLSMGWCLECHRTTPAEPGQLLPPDSVPLRERDHVSTDCSSCHI